MLCLNRTSLTCSRIRGLVVTASVRGVYKHLTCYRCRLIGIASTRVPMCCREQMNFEVVTLSLNYRPFLFISCAYSSGPDFRLTYFLVGTSGLWRRFNRDVVTFILPQCRSGFGVHRTYRWGTRGCYIWYKDSLSVKLVIYLNIAGRLGMYRGLPPLHHAHLMRDARIRQL